jgi:TM2 domain-containing membrane protein YozV
VTQVRPEIYKAIEENDMEKVFFSDPFIDVTRKSKRNLLVASFISILISILHLEINGFLGLKATNTPLGNEVAQGLAFFIVLYFFLSFTFQAFIDYIAWNFSQEKYLTKPYLELVSLIESQISVTGEQIKNATYNMSSLSDDDRMQDQVHNSSVINSSKQQLDSINTNLSSVITEFSPLLKMWAKELEKMNKLSVRLKVRFLNLWALDIIFPLLVSLAVLYLCYSGIPSLLMRFGS